MSENTCAMRPAWDHDCDQCHYIGTVMTPECANDWYVHRYVTDEVGTRDTLIVRFGHDGPEYRTPVSERPQTQFEHVGSGRKFYSSDVLTAYALRTAGLVDAALKGRKS